MSFKLQILKGLQWTAGTRFLGQLVAWGVTILVMRILTPTDYGLLAMATVMVSFLSLFAEMGLGGAVVQARDVDTLTLRRVFGLVLVVNGSLFALLAALAPFVSSFFGDARLTDITRVIATQFLVFALGAIPDAQLQRQLEFKWRSLVEFSSVIANAALTLGLALKGYGVWSLVYGSLMAAVWRTAGINVLHPFLHMPSFDFRSMGKLFSFGGHTVLARVLGVLGTQADTIIGGRMLGQEQIGYYSVGMNLATLPMQRVAAIINIVAFPAIARLQEEHDRILSYMLRSLRLLNVFSFSVFWGIASVAPEIVRVFLGPQWEPAILPLQVLAFAMPLRMLWQFMPAILQGLGHAKLVAQNHLLYLVMVAAFLIAVQFGIIGLSLAWLVAFPFILLAAMWTWLPVFEMRASQYLQTMKTPAIAGAGMCVSVFAVRSTEIADGLKGLGLLVATGATSFALLCWVFDRRILQDIRAMLERGG